MIEKISMTPTSRLVPVLELDGPASAINDSIEVEVTGGRLFGSVSVDGESRVLDAEDALGVDDSVVHSSMTSVPDCS
ncbi:hypothetical protein [Cutibacterium sp.]|uniref:hypothetical protein n=1 Tax=Cutibacterium sp. TaxID=1912221 RepID=UPI0026DD9711|nr:hypothetical protein [Cutibacterium sp.]MDO4412229.1 hypothetical protein [Cutibacterium sp.]